LSSARELSPLLVEWHGDWFIDISCNYMGGGSWGISCKSSMGVSHTVGEQRTNDIGNNLPLAMRTASIYTYKCMYVCIIYIKYIK
jgi:hypothetical protein